MANLYVSKTLTGIVLTEHDIAVVISVAPAIAGEQQMYTDSFKQLTERF